MLQTYALHWYCSITLYSYNLNILYAHRTNHTCMINYEAHCNPHSINCKLCYAKKQQIQTDTHKSLSHFTQRWTNEHANTYRLFTPDLYSGTFNATPRKTYVLLHTAQGDHDNTLASMSWSRALSRLRSSRSRWLLSCSRFRVSTLRISSACCAAVCRFTWKHTVRTSNSRHSVLYQIINHTSSKPA